MNKNYLLIFGTALIFSTIELCGKLTSGLNAFQVTFLRFFIGAIILLPFALSEIKKKKMKFDNNDIIFFIIEGVLCIPVSMVLLQLSVKYTQASTAAVIFCTNPIFTIPLAYFILGERISKASILSSFLSIVGVLFIFNPFKLQTGAVGIVLSLLAAVIFSLYSVLSKTRISKYGGFIFNAMSFIFGDFILLILLFLFRIPILKGITYSNAPVILFMGVVVTGLGYIIFLYAILKNSVVASSAVFFIKPALAPVLSLIFLREQITMNVIIGILFIILGSFAGNMKIIVPKKEFD